MTQELSDDSDDKLDNIKNSGKIHRFFTDLMNYIQKHKGYTLLDEKMLQEEE